MHLLLNSTWQKILSAIEWSIYYTKSKGSNLYQRRTLNFSTAKDIFLVLTSFRFDWYMSRQIFFKKGTQIKIFNLIRMEEWKISSSILIDFIHVFTFGLAIVGLFSKICFQRLQFLPFILYLLHYSINTKRSLKGHIYLKKTAKIDSNIWKTLKLKNETLLSKFQLCR